MLELRNVRAGYRRLEILQDVSLTVGDGEIVSLIGANGAGKTTTLRSIAGIINPSAGEIYFDGRKISGMNADTIVRAGLSHVAEDRELFGDLKVWENLQMGAFTQPRSSINDSLSQVFDMFPILAERRDQRANTLSGGQQQMLAIGRALMARPKCITLDEPSVGLAPNLAAQVLQTIVQIRNTGVTVLIVEQNAKQALGISDRAYVMENGAIALEGNGADLIDDTRVREAYLGL